MGAARFSSMHKKWARGAGPTTIGVPLRACGAEERNPRMVNSTGPYSPLISLQASVPRRQNHAGGGPWLGSSRCDPYDGAFAHADGRHRRQNPTALLAEPTMISPVFAPVRAFCSTTGIMFTVMPLEVTPLPA